MKVDTEEYRTLVERRREVDNSKKLACDLLAEIAKEMVSIVNEPRSKSEIGAFLSAIDTPEGEQIESLRLNVHFDVRNRAINFVSAYVWVNGQYLENFRPDRLSGVRRLMEGLLSVRFGDEVDVYIWRGGCVTFVVDLLSGEVSFEKNSGKKLMMDIVEGDSRFTIDGGARIYCSLL